MDYDPSVALRNEQEDRNYRAREAADCSIGDRVGDVCADPACLVHGDDPMTLVPEGEDS